MDHYEELTLALRGRDFQASGRSYIQILLMNVVIIIRLSLS